MKQASEVTQLARVRARALVQVRGLPSVTPPPSGRVLSLQSLTLVSSFYTWGRRDSNELKLKLCCCCSVAQLCLTLQCYGLAAARQASLSLTISQTLLKLMSNE